MERNEMKVSLGVDLSGSPKNDTGLCVLEVEEGKKSVDISLVKTDVEILQKIEACSPDIIAIDAPLTPAANSYMRAADEEMKKYGALPHNLRGMTYLVERGNKLAQLLTALGKPHIEVFNAATAKILGFYDKDRERMQKNLLQLGIEGNIKKKMLNKDELDAISAALTGYLYLMKKTKEVGDKEGKIVVPKV